MFGGEVDTLALLFDKLRYIFGGYDTIRETFLKSNDIYKEGKISEKEYFEKLYESVNRFSALEFLLVKAEFEIKKTLDKSNNIVSNNNQNLNHSPARNSIDSFIMIKNLPGHDDVQKLSQNSSHLCSNCGFNIGQSSKFCTNCGIKIMKN